MLINYLQQAYIFQGLSVAELESVAQWAREKIIEPDEFVYHKGDAGTDFFVIAEGKVQLIVEKHGDSLHFSLTYRYLTFNDSSCH